MSGVPAVCSCAPRRHVNRATGGGSGYGRHVRSGKSKGRGKGVEEERLLGPGKSLSRVVSLILRLVGAAGACPMGGDCRCFCRCPALLLLLLRRRLLRLAHNHRVTQGGAASLQHGGRLLHALLLGGAALGGHCGQGRKGKEGGVGWGGAGGGRARQVGGHGEWQQCEPRAAGCFASRGCNLWVPLPRQGEPRRAHKTCTIQGGAHRWRSRRAGAHQRLGCSCWCGRPWSGRRRGRPSASSTTAGKGREGQGGEDELDRAACKRVQRGLEAWGAWRGMEG